MSRTAKTVEDSFAAGIIEDAKLVDALELAFIPAALIVNYKLFGFVEAAGSGAEGTKEFFDALKGSIEGLPRAGKRMTSNVINAAKQPNREVMKFVKSRPGRRIAKAYGPKGVARRIKRMM